MKLLHISVASILGSSVGLLLLLGITFQSHTRLEAAKSELDELFELRQRIDHLSMASDSLLLFGAGPELCRRLRAEAEDIERRLRRQGLQHPKALKAAHRVQVLIDAVAHLAAPADSGLAPDNGSVIEPPPMTERVRIILSQIASHGAVLDIALDALLRERRQAITEDANQIAIRLAGAAILFALLCISAFALIYWRVAAPVRSLMQTLERIYQGDSDARATVKGADELALLAAALNRMLDQRDASTQRLHQYRELVEGSEDLMSIADEQYRYLLVNQAYARRFGRDRAEIEGVHMGDVLGRGYFDSVLKTKLDGCLAGDNQRFETERLDSDGHRRQFLARYFPIETQSPQGRQVVAVITDISEFKLVETKLREQSQLLDIAGRLGRIGGWRVDLSTNRAQWSDTVAEIHGMPNGFPPRSTKASPSTPRKTLRPFGASSATALSAVSFIARISESSMPKARRCGCALPARPSTTSTAASAPFRAHFRTFQLRNLQKRRQKP